MSLPYMPLYVADYLADTGHLSTLEHGAYLLLIMHYWRTGGLPNDEAILARICRLQRRDWERCRDNLLGLFSSDLTHKRIDAELEKGRVTSERRALAGARGGKAKALKNNDAYLANATAGLQPGSGISESYIKDELDKSNPSSLAGSWPAQDGAAKPAKQKKPKASPSETEQQFEQLRAAYPRRLGENPRKPAFEKFKRFITNGVPFANILAAADRYKRNAVAAGKEGTEFVKQMQFWLSAEPWNDLGSDERSAPANRSGAPEATSADKWRQRVQVFRNGGTWAWGKESPEPGAPGCTVPAEILSEFGYAAPRPRGRDGPPASRNDPPDLFPAARA